MSVAEANDTYEESRKAYIMIISSRHTEELQETACSDPYWAHKYATNVKEADIEYCQKAVCDKSPYYAYYFARDVKGADLDKCLEAIRGSKWENKVMELITSIVIG